MCCCRYNTHTCPVSQPGTAKLRTSAMFVGVVNVSETNFPVESLHCGETVVLFLIGQRTDALCTGKFWSLPDAALGFKAVQLRVPQRGT